MPEAENNASELSEWAHARLQGIDNEKGKIPGRTGLLSLNDEKRQLARGSVVETPQGEYYQQKVTREDKPSDDLFLENLQNFNEPQITAIVQVTRELENRLKSLLAKTSSETRPSQINHFLEQVATLTEQALEAAQEAQREQGETLGRREFHGLHHIAETWGNVFELQVTLKRYGLSIDSVDLAHALLALAFHDVVQTVGAIVDKEGNALEPIETIEWLNRQQSVKTITSQGALLRRRVGGGQIEAESAEALIEALGEMFSGYSETDRELMTKTLTAAIMATQPGFNPKTPVYSVYQVNLDRPALSPEPKPTTLNEPDWQAWQLFAERVRALVAFGDLGTSAMQPELALRQGLALRFEDSLELNRLLSRTLELADTAELSSKNLLSAWKKYPEFATAIRERVQTWLGVQVNFIEGQRLQLTQSKPENADATVPDPPRYSLDLLFENLDWGNIKEEQKQTIIDQFKQELSERLEELKQQNRELIQAINQPEGGLQLLAERIAEALKPSYSLAKPLPES